MLAVVAMATPIAAQVSPVDQALIESGRGSFVVSGGAGREEKTITVFYYKPESFHRGSPVMLVVPGAGRNGDDYRDAWVGAAEHYGVLILSPSYSEASYPEFWSYNLAGMTSEVTFDLDVVVDTATNERSLDEVRQELGTTIGMHALVGQGPGHQVVYKLVLLSKAGMLATVDALGINSTANMDPSKWIFSDFDRIFQLAKDDLDLQATDYDLFGHSAGGQILHRFALFHPDSKAGRILASNAGWYTMPTFAEGFPYGLTESGLTTDQLKPAFGKPLVVFLGEEDDQDETRGSLRRTPEADRQGAHRLARGKTFYGTGREVAEALGADFEWKLEVIPGIGHDYERMSAAAADYLYGDRAE